MNPGRDLFIILFVFIAIVVLVMTLDMSGSANRSTGGNLPSASINLSQSTQEDDAESQAREIEKRIKDAEDELEQVAFALEEIELYGEPSPYTGMVTLKKSASGPRSTDVNKEYIELRADSANTAGIGISKWRLESSITGRSVELGKGAKLFFSGSINSKEAIFVLPEETVYVTTGRSPVGESFHTNKCIGYFTQFQKFIPTIKKECPSPQDEILSYSRDTSIFVDNACMDFIDRMRACRVETDPLPLSLSYPCQDAIITEINYARCIEKHKDDADFYGTEWRIYLRHDLELWRYKREVIKLLDENGLTVDYFSY